MDLSKRLSAIGFALILIVSMVAMPAIASPVSTTTDEGPVETAGTQPSATFSDTQPTGAHSEDTTTATISGAVQQQVRQTDSSDKIPVIIVFEQQPQDEFDLQSLSGAAAQDRMKELARTEQEQARSYLAHQQTRGRADDIRSFWSRNAISVHATPSTIEEVASLPEVARVVYDQQVTPASETGSSSVSTLTDTLGEYGSLAEPSGYEVSRTGDRAWGVEYIGADAVQDRGVTGEGVNVSVIDTGIDGGHPALEDTVTEWKDFTADNYTTPTDPMGHGTHVAGTIAGQSDAQNAVGVAPGANLFGAKVFSESEPTRTSDMLSAFEWSAESGADVISASIGVPPMIERYSGVTTVSDGATAADNVTIYGNANETLTENQSNSTDLSYESYKPSSVMVLVEPQEINGTSIQNDTRKAEVMSNLSLSLTDPAGNETLERHEAHWAYNGEVPDQIGYYKYKPTASTPIQSTGNWSVEVANAYDENVSYEFVATPVYPTNGSDQLVESIDSLTDSHDVTPVIAAGNYGFIFGNRTVSSPGAASSAITVAASGYRVNDVAPFSSRGPVAFGTDERPGIDLMAPGTAVLSAHSRAQSTADEPYVSMSGTSMATPHVSGTAALMRDADPSLTLSETRTLLRNTTQSTPAADVAAGAGMLDAWAAVNETNADALASDPEQSGVHELHAGLGETGERAVHESNDPVFDPVGDAGDGPDIRASTRSIAEELEIATDGSGPANATFNVYLDMDRDDTTGDTNRSGAEYVVVLNRTFDGANYYLRSNAYAFNESTGSYGLSDNVSTSSGSVSSEIVELNDIAFANYPKDVRFDWHATAMPDGADSVSDRHPDSGQIDVGQTEIRGVAVAWNASGGHADAGANVTFSLYDRAKNGELAQRNVTTDADGFAETTFTVNTPYQDHLLEVSDEYGNVVEQAHLTDTACVEYCLTDGSGLAYETEDRDYRVEHNETVTVNVPVYNETDMAGYEGPASVTFGEFSVDPVVKDNLTVSDGVLTTTLDLSETRLDDESSYFSMHLALTDNFSQATATERVADFSVQSETTSTELSPLSTVVGPSETATMSFQHSSSDGTSVNESATYEAFWLTDRNVQALSQKLPADTAESLDQQREAALRNADESHLTTEDRRAITEAIQELEAQGVTIATESGTADPTRHGVGTFGVTPPEDARYGFVSGGSSSNSLSGLSLVVVDGRLEDLTDRQTEPRESTRYDLDVESGWRDWGTHQEGDYMLPNESFSVDVSLYDHETDSYVDGESVTLYTSGGNTTTVTTNGSGPVAVDLPAPDLDYRNVSYEKRYQEVRGIANGYTDADGHAVADSTTPYARVDRIVESSDVVYPVTQTRYDNGTLRTTVDYRNESYEAVSGEPTLLLVSQTDGWAVDRDLHVGYVDPGTETSITRNVTDSNPPSVDESASYEAAATTPSFEYTWLDETMAAGASTAIDSPSTFSTDNNTVTVTVTDRDGEPVTDAAVVWNYVVFEKNANRSYQAAVPAKLDGDTRVGVTDANGTVSFTVSPSIDDETASLTWSTGFATENASQQRAQYGTATVSVNETDDEPPTVTNASASVATAELNETVVSFGVDADDTVGIDRYEWDFDGDDVTDETTSTSNVSHVYSERGTKTPSVTVVDTAENTNTTALPDVTVEDTTPPATSVSGPSPIVVNTTSVFDASETTDNGAVEYYRWDLTGDGSVDRNTTTATTSWNYTDVNQTVTVTVTAVDQSNNTANASYTAETTAAPTVAIKTPADAATVDDSDVTVNYTLADLDAIDTDHVEYRVDDGTWQDTGNGAETNGSVTVADLSDGTHSIALRIVDSNGDALPYAASEATVSVTVDTSSGGGGGGGGSSLDPANVEVTILEAPSSVAAGETMDLKVDLRNTGDATATQEITLNIDGQTVATSDERVISNNGKYITFTHAVETDADSLTATVSSADDSDSVNVPVSDGSDEDDADGDPSGDDDANGDSSGNTDTDGSDSESNDTDSEDDESDDSGADDNTSNDTETATDQGSPGFGVSVAILSLLIAVSLARRRTE